VLAIEDDLELFEEAGRRYPREESTLVATVARRPQMERRSGVVCAGLIESVRADIALFIINVRVQP
jgi:hypothetical protein